MSKWKRGGLEEDEILSATLAMVVVKGQGFIQAPTTKCFGLRKISDEGKKSRRNIDKMRGRETRLKYSRNSHFVHISTGEI